MNKAIHPIISHLFVNPCITQEFLRFTSTKAAFSADFPQENVPPNNDELRRRPTFPAIPSGGGPQRSLKPFLHRLQLAPLIRRCNALVKRPVDFSSFVIGRTKTERRRGGGGGGREEGGGGNASRGGSRQSPLKTNYKLAGTERRAAPPPPETPGCLRRRYRRSRPSHPLGYAAPILRRDRARLLCVCVSAGLHQLISEGIGSRWPIETGGPIVAPLAASPLSTLRYSVV
ncbi:hypothetical protein GWI33_006750 [Rhynchophorus ferrugineus]|uniref:Uncharacterized protein n=1 Tax=Rhynchophorus ferrugineus TaxID=354439 RepID=A0A834MCP8_RHYFE|nr:hypothetical protein GWI33_006750 [Rhynchophorus ferrugineus]